MRMLVIGIAVALACEVAEARSLPSQATAFQVLKDTDLTIDVSDVNFEGKRFLFSYAIGTKTDLGDIHYDMDHAVTLGEFDVVEGGRYNLGNIGSGEYVKMWVTEPASNFSRVFGIRELAGSNEFYPEGMSVSVPVDYILQTPAYTITISGMKSENGNVYAAGSGTASGQPLPGVLATIAVAGVMMRCMKSRKIGSSALK